MRQEMEIPLNNSEGRYCTGKKYDINILKIQSDINLRKVLFCFVKTKAMACLYTRQFANKELWLLAHCGKIGFSKIMF